MANATTTRIWTIGDLLTWTTDFFHKKNIDEGRLSAELLLAHALGCTRMALYTQYERVPAESQLAAFREAVKQRAEHVPVAYLIGKASFFSLDFCVNRQVLIPRPDTETLVEQTIQRIRQAPGWETPTILDLCTGSGCIAIALAKNLPLAHVVATDQSAEALTLAGQNAQTLGVGDRVSFGQGDLFAALGTVTPPPPQFHTIVSNPPYIATGQIAGLQPEVRDHEPRAALDGGPDGLVLIRRIIAEASDHLRPGGLLGIEIAFDQGPMVQTLFAEAGYLENIRIVRDAAGNQRCVIANKVPIA
ncbi:MAG: peptide chain release factor N(5)-glutamine methyltransferase [Phycisphaerae bacterium]